MGMDMIKDEINPNRFSFLPDHVIVFILSFLPFTDSARTSVLSTRWRHLWRETGTIEFRESLFTRREDFIEFIRQWTRNGNDTAVDTFSLSFLHPGQYRSDMEDCLRFAVLRRVKRLYLEFSHPSWPAEGYAPEFDLPAFVYQHKIIESLKLFSCRFDVSEFRAFGALKDLSLGWIEITSSSLKALLINCPLLGSLCLKNCWISGDTDISGPNLKLRRLIIDNCFLDYQIILMVQNLEYFKYYGLVVSFYLEDQPEVKEVELDFGLESEFDDTGFSGETLQDMLSYLYPVTLTVCSVTLQEIPTGAEPLRLYPSLKDLRHLILKTSVHSNELWGIAFMLKACPGLERLTIDLSGSVTIFHDYKPPIAVDDYLFWSVHAPFVECVREKLKVVEVNGFRGVYNEIQLLQTLILYGNVLELMKINIVKIKADSSDPMLHQCWADMFNHFSRPSQNLQILIS